MLIYQKKKRPGGNFLSNKYANNLIGLKSYHLMFPDCLKYKRYLTMKHNDSIPLPQQFLGPVTFKDHYNIIIIPLEWKPEFTTMVFF